MSRVEIFIDGERYDGQAGETILEIAQRNGIEIPTLCHDPRLEPAGACRTCLVEVDGERRLQPACAYRVERTIEVATTSERIARHRRVLAGLYAADHTSVDGFPVQTPNGNDLRSFVAASDALPLAPVASLRRGRPDDANPYIGFDPDLCILCARCTRYCDEVEGVSAITLIGRGAETTIGTVAARGLLDTTCELCGGCIDTCPTGAMIEKKAPEVGRDLIDAEKVRTTCAYCGVGCQLDLNVAGGRVVKITSPQGETVNDGNLCVKGRFAYDFIHHEDRLTTPLIRGADGELHPTTWKAAIARVAAGLMQIKEAHGADALAFVSSSRCTGEENYLLQKLARAAFGTNNCHQCAAT